MVRAETRFVIHPFDRFVLGPDTVAYIVHAMASSMYGGQTWVGARPR